MFSGGPKPPQKPLPGARNGPLGPGNEVPEHKQSKMSRNVRHDTQNMTKGIGKTSRKRLTTPKTRNRHREQGPYPDLKGFLYQSPCCTLGVLVALLPLLQGHRQTKTKTLKHIFPLRGTWFRLVALHRPKRNPKRTQKGPKGLNNVLLFCL